MDGMDLVERIKDSVPKAGSVRFIGIDGHGGSGKSTLANLLSAKLNAQIIHTDDFASWDNPQDWWPAVIEQILEPIKHGADKLSYPRSKWSETHNPKPVVDQPVTKIMILEGVSSLRREFRLYLSFGVFVDTPANICLQRGFERDKDQYGKTDDEVRRMWRDWYEKEKIYMQRDNPKHFANVVLDGTAPFEAQIT